MRLYRAEFRGDGSEGFEWFSNKRDAEKCKREHTSKDGESSVEITPLEIEMNKAGVLRFLNHHASYPDNG